MRREALERIGGFDTSIEFHGEDTNVGRRLSAIGKVGLFHDCYLHTSARRYIAMGKRQVFRLYIRELRFRASTPSSEGHRPPRRPHLMPGYEPFLLCDFHVHTKWSDGRLSIRDVVDLYGSTGKFDVIAITDHILMRKDLLARIGRVATLGLQRFGLREEDFEAYLAEIASEGERSLKRYGMLVIPGAEVTQNRLRGRKNSHIIALDIKKYISADQSAEAILREIRRQGALSIACHPHHRAPRRFEISTCYLWDHPEGTGGPGGRMGGCQPGRFVSRDEPETLSLHRQQRFSQAEASLFVEDPGPVREALAGNQRRAPQQRRRGVDAVSRRLVESKTVSGADPDYCAVLLDDHCLIQR